MAIGQFPKTITTYPILGIEAARRSSGIGGAWRVWVLAKALDVIGLGMVRRDDLRAFAVFLGVNVRTWQRWTNEARAAGFIMDIQKGAEWWLLLPSAARVAMAMGLANVGTRKVTIPAGAVIGQGWKARIFTAWEHGKHISREKIQKEINIPVSTQRYRDSQVGVKRERNYSKSNLRGDSFAGVREYTKHKAPFISGNGFIYWRLPDRRFTKHAQPARKGRARKVNQTIRNANQKGLSIMRRALSDGTTRGQWVRLFNLTEAQRRQSERKINRHNIRVIELYQRDHETPRGAVVWEHCPTAGRG